MTETGLRRAVGRWDVVALGINGTIGGGIYFAPALVAARLGAASPWAFLAGGLVVLLVVLCMAEAATYFDEAGGVYLYGRAAFGELIGFEAGFLAWLARTIGLSSILVGFAQALSYFAPATGAGVGRAVAIVAPVVVLTTINVVGVKAGARTSTLVTIVKLVPLGLFVVAGLLAVRQGPLIALAPVQPGAWTDSAPLVLFAFVGFEATTAAAGEFRNPKRDLPFALIVQVAVVTVFYVGVQYVVSRTLPNPGSSQKPLADAAQVFIGRPGGWTLTLGAAISVLGITSVILLTAPRYLYALASAHGPQVLARVDRRFGTPSVAIMAQGAVALVLALLGSFAVLAALAALLRIVVYLIVAAAIPRLRRQFGADPGRFRVPGGPTIPALAMVLCLVLLGTASLVLIAGSALAALAGAAWYFWAQGRNASLIGPGPAAPRRRR